jgi:TolB-like protein
MGTVYRAVDTLLGRPVALKFPRRDLLHDPAMRRRFLDEAKAAATLDHPNIVVLYDVGESGEDLFMAMQFVEGPTLRERLSEGPFPHDVAQRVGREIADALAHAHGRGVIHRDVKPENVVLDRDGRAKVLDFGVARILADAEATRSGARILGTLPFAAPEILRGGDADPRSDLFSLGILLYELCAGRHPFPAAHPAALTRAILEDDPKPLPDGVPEVLRSVIRSLLEKDPRRRPESAVAVSDALYPAPEAGPAGVAAPAGGSGPPSARLSAFPARSIAILPFENLSRDPDHDFFGAGMTEELLTELLKVSDLRVASKSLTDAARASGVDPRRAALQHGLSTLLEGSVRRAGDRVRVTARLVRAADGVQLWAERYDRDLRDIFQVQEEIARRIADALRVTFDPAAAEARAGRRTASPRAYELRLRAAALSERLEEPDVRAAIDLLEEALREDPGYALARADLAECCVQMVCKSWDLDPRWLDRAEREAERARELAPQLSDGYRSLGHIWNHRGDQQRALRELHFAIDLDPRLAFGHGQLGSTYLFLGDYARAEIYTRRGRDLEPENPRTRLMLATVLLRQGRTQECRRELADALATSPSSYITLAVYEDLVPCLMMENDRERLNEAVAFLRGRVGDRGGMALGLLAFVAAERGAAEEARRLLEEERREPCTHHQALVNVARAWCLLGEAERCEDALRRAVRAGHLDHDGVRTDRWLRPSEDLLRRIGVPLA